MLFIWKIKSLWSSFNMQSAKWKMVKAACSLFTAPFANFLYCCHIVVCSFERTNFSICPFSLSLQGKFQQARQLKLKKSGRLTLPGVNTSKVQKPKTRSSRVRWVLSYFTNQMFWLTKFWTLFFIFWDKEYCLSSDEIMCHLV